MTDETAQLKTKEYVHPMPATWWLKRKTYFLFMVRELTCVAVGGYAMLLLVLVGCAHDKDSFQAFLTWMKESRMSMALHLIALPMVLYHSVTWLNLTPKAIVVWRGEEQLSPFLIVGLNYVAWAIVSILIAWISLG